MSMNRIQGILRFTSLMHIMHQPLALNFDGIANKSIVEPLNLHINPFDCFYNAVHFLTAIETHMCLKVIATLGMYNFKKHFLFLVLIVKLTIVFTLFLVLQNLKRKL
jgi:hypothetical protein